MLLLCTYAPEHLRTGNASGVPLLHVVHRGTRESGLEVVVAVTVRDDARVLLRIRQLLLRAERQQRGGTMGRRRVPVREPVAPDETGERGYEPFDPVQTPATVATGKRLKGQHWLVLGPAPICGPGDVGTAQRFHVKIQRTIEMGCWKHSERTALLQLERVWGARARGDDPRFVLVGNRAGRLDRMVEKKITGLRESKRGRR